MLSGSDTQILFEAARNAIEAAVKGSRIKKPSAVSESLKQLAGVFVTLRIDRELRGCIGYVDAIKSIYETVQDAAAKAAVDDLRFDPVTMTELPYLDLEISVLSPLSPIQDINCIEIGTHGLVVDLGNHRGLLLPQVATELGWDPETFVCQTTQKAGLPATMWRHPDIKLFTFTAEIMHQNAAPHHAR